MINSGTGFGSGRAQLSGDQPRATETVEKICSEFEHFYSELPLGRVFITLRMFN